jgi:hypothetical protein
LTMLISFGMIYLDYYQYMGLRNLEWFWKLDIKIWKDIKKSYLISIKIQ